jgi:hypothetical protein
VAYDPTSGMQKEWPHLTVRSRYHQNAEELLNLVQRVEQGEPLPLRSPVVIEYGEIDPDVRAHLQSVGATEGVSGHEFLRRAVEREMMEAGEGGALVVVVGADEREEEEESAVVGKCVTCGAGHLDVFYTSRELGYSLCRSCYEAHQAKGQGTGSDYNSIRLSPTVKPLASQQGRMRLD